MSGGITHTPAQIELARQNRHIQPIADCVTRLKSAPDDAMTGAWFAGLRYQLDGAVTDADQAIQLLRDKQLPTPDSADRASSCTWLAWLSAAALLHDHANYAELLEEEAAELAASVESLPSPDDALDELWLGALQLASGIVWRHDPCIQLGASTYRDAIDSMIHPEGFLKGIVDDESRPQTYAAQVSGCCALTLMAEMGQVAGLDLWEYDNRGVTPITAATYALYYFFYPEQWRWSESLTAAETAASMRGEGAFLEIVNRRQPLSGVDALFGELRPLFCAYGGGMTTLTHGMEPPRKRRRFSLRRRNS